MVTKRLPRCSSKAPSTYLPFCLVLKSQLLYVLSNTYHWDLFEIVHKFPFPLSSLHLHPKWLNRNIIVTFLSVNFSCNPRNIEGIYDLRNMIFFYFFLENMISVHFNISTLQLLRICQIEKEHVTGPKHRKVKHGNLRVIL